MGNKIYINLVEQFAGGDGVAAAGDELLVRDFGNITGPTDWHFTQACVGNNSSSLCGAQDALPDGSAFATRAMASVGGAGSGRVFYEFSRPPGSPNSTAGPAKEDLRAVSGQLLGLRLRVTQGQGGGKGGFVHPDPQTSPQVYHQFRRR